jgi:hypothetical protein
VLAQDQVLRQVVQALQAAQEEVLALAQEQVRVLGLAVAQVEALAQAQKVALEWDLQGAQALVQAEEQVEVLEPWEKRQVVREMELG